MRTATASPIVTNPKSEPNDYLKRSLDWIDAQPMKSSKKKTNKAAAKRVVEMWENSNNYLRNTKTKSQKIFSWEFWSTMGANYHENEVLQRTKPFKSDLKEFVIVLVQKLNERVRNIPQVYEAIIYDFDKNAAGISFWKDVIDDNRIINQYLPKPGSVDSKIILSHESIILSRSLLQVSPRTVTDRPELRIIGAFLTDDTHRYDWFQLDNTIKIRRETIDPLFEIIISVPKLHVDLVTLEGDSVTVEQEELSWHMEPGDNATMHPKLRTTNGELLEGTFVRYGKSPAYYLIGSKLYHCSNNWFDSRKIETTIPSFAPSLLKDKNILKFAKEKNLNYLGHDLEKISLCHPTAQIICWLEDVEGKGEYFCAKVFALDKNGEQACYRTDQGWEGFRQPEDEESDTENHKKSPPKLYTSASLDAISEQLGKLPFTLDYNRERKIHTAVVHAEFENDFTNWFNSKPEEIEVHVQGELKSLAKNSQHVEVEINIRSSGVDWFSVSLQTNVKGLEFSPAEILSLLSASRISKNSTVRTRVKNKGWVVLDTEELNKTTLKIAELGTTLEEVASGEGKAHVLNVARSSSLNNNTTVLKKAQARVKQLFNNRSITPPNSFTATLRPYQLEGFRFLAFLATTKLGGILADDMGLGKTVQTIAWLTWLYESKTKAKSRKNSFRALILSPKSVIDVWVKELQRFAPELADIIITNPLCLTTQKGSYVVILGYAQARLKAPLLHAQVWDAVVLDEAQAIKNPGSQTTKAIYEIKAQNRLALTGTPIENRLLDLWSIMNFVQPHVLGESNTYKKAEYNEELMMSSYLKAQVRPFMVRRTKAQVLTDLPPCVQKDIICEMTAKQILLYNAELKKAQRLLLLLKNGGREAARAKFLILTSLMKLRQIACHPGLVDPKLKNHSSSKVEAAIDIILPVIDSGNSVVVFSQFLGMLAFMESALKKHKINTFLLTGATQSRGKLLESFTNEERPSVFLISLKAGGTGLNLTKASHVILLDPWWNPAVEQQAIDRLHRIGQKSSVNAYRLLAKDSVEERVRQLQKMKSDLVSAVIDDDALSATLTSEDFAAVLNAA
jgi:SNF2 family DNA or RNA helicase